MSNLEQNDIIDKTEEMKILAPQNIQHGQQDYDKVQSIIVKKDQKGNVINQYTQIIRIIRINKTKPFIGGFRKLASDIECWNAYAQTDQKRTKHKLCYTRQTQTFEWISKSTKSKRQTGTQMQKQGLFLDTRTDKQMQPAMYFHSQMWSQRRNQAALYIQRLTRGWFARKRAMSLKNNKQKQIQVQIQIQNKKKKNQEIRHKEEIQRRKNPKNKKDFQILYHQLQIWRITELQKIRTNKQLTQQQRKKALKQTLDKQIDLLQTIDRLKIAANKGQKIQKIDKYLKDMSDPKQWTRKSDGRVTEVHTPFTIRAKQLMDLYKGLKMKNISTDQRLDILLNTKWTVKQWDCNLTRQIVELIDRQANMLDRGRPQKSLQGLRQRLANLFLQFIEYPLFNPQAARFQKIPYQIPQITQDKVNNKNKNN